MRPDGLIFQQLFFKFEKTGFLILLQLYINDVAQGVSPGDDKDAGSDSAVAVL